MVGLFVCLVYPIGLNKVFQFLPILMLSTIFGSLALISHKKTDFSYIWNVNKSYFFFIILVFIISIDHETCLSVFYATIIYFMIYFRTKDYVKMYDSKKILFQIKTEVPEELGEEKPIN